MLCVFWRLHELQEKCQATTNIILGSFQCSQQQKNLLLWIFLGVKSVQPVVKKIITMLHPSPCIDKEVGNRLKKVKKQVMFMECKQDT